METRITGEIYLTLTGAYFRYAAVQTTAVGVGVFRELGSVFFHGRAMLVA